MENIKGIIVKNTSALDSSYKPTYFGIFKCIELQLFGKQIRKRVEKKVGIWSQKLLLIYNTRVNVKRQENAIAFKKKG